MHMTYNYVMSDKSRRQQRILDLIQSRPIKNQHQIRDLLSAEGIYATQATISRDLRDLGVAKTPIGYAPIREVSPEAPPTAELQRAIRAYLLRVEAAGTLVVLHVGPGRAPLLAQEIDRARLRGVVGSIAGDDTVFLATRAPRDALRLTRDLRQMAGME